MYNSAIDKTAATPSLTYLNDSATFFFDYRHIAKILFPTPHVVIT